MTHLNRTGLHHECILCPTVELMPSSLGRRIISNMLQMFYSLLRLRLSSALSRLWRRGRISPVRSQLPATARDPDALAAFRASAFHPARAWLIAVSLLCWRRFIADGQIDAYSPVFSPVVKK